MMKSYRAVNALCEVPFEKTQMRSVKFSIT